MTESNPYDFLASVGLSNSKPRLRGPHDKAFQALAVFCLRNGEVSPTLEQEAEIAKAWDNTASDFCLAVRSLRIRFFKDPSSGRRGAEVSFKSEDLGYSARLTAALLRSIDGIQAVGEQYRRAA